MNSHLTSVMFTVEVYVEVVENLVEVVEKSGMARVSPVAFWGSLRNFVIFPEQKSAQENYGRSAFSEK